jgi:hypothetical protein
MCIKIKKIPNTRCFAYVFIMADFLVGLRFELWDLHMQSSSSHTSSPFCSGYFGGELFAWAGLRCQSSQSQPPK